MTPPKTPTPKSPPLRQWVSAALLGFCVAALLWYFGTHAVPHTPQNFTNSLAGKYLAARFAERQNNMEDAAVLLGETLRREPKNRALLERSFALNIIAGRMEQALQIAAQQQAQSQAGFAQVLLLATEEMRKGNFPQADKFMAALDKADAKEVQKIQLLLVPMVRAWALIGQGRYPDARLLMEQVEIPSELIPFVLYQRALLADVGGAPKDAAKLYDSLLKILPRPSLRLVLAASSFYQRIGRMEVAQTVLENFNSQHKDIALPLPKAPPIASANEGLAEFLLETASLLYSRQMEETAMVYLNIALHLRADLPYAQFLLASLQEGQGAHQRAVVLLERVPEGDPFYRKAQYAIARNTYKAGEKEGAKRFLTAFIRKHPGDTEAKSLLADFLIQEKNYRDALEIYNALLENTEKAHPERWNWLFARGIALERLKQWPEAENDFFAALELEPDHPEILNYLAYSWLVAGTNLEKALDMLKTALEQRPTDAHIIDSYGWALYTLGKYEDALLYLERANEMMPSDPTVNDHLGDVYWALGRQREARFQWERALTFNPEKEDAAAIRDKLNHGLRPGKN